MSKVLILVMPCYNEEEVLEETARQAQVKLRELMGQGRISKDSRILFVDDGSRDRTWALITSLYEQPDSLVCGLKLAHNRGHQKALYAGLMAAREMGEASVSMDADLQDDLSVLDGFLDAWEDGCEIVYGVRKSRETDTFFKRSTALAFYRLMRGMGADIVENHADCRLMTRKAMDALAGYREVNLFLRGIVPDIGYKTAIAYYDRNPRFAGESKYPLKKMLMFAWDGITSFSVKPLKLISQTGFLMFFVSIAALIYALASKIQGSAVSGWTALIGSVWLIGGAVMISLGILGEYLGKLYQEVKDRPRYLEEVLLKK